MATTYFRKVTPSNIGALDQDFSSYSTASTYSGNELIPMRQNGSTVYTDLSSIATFAGGGSSQQALTNYKMTTATLTGDGTVKTIQDSNITSDMVVIEASLSNPAAQANDITITTSNGSFTIGPANALVSGASTTITLTFGVAYSTAPNIAVNLASNSTANLLQAEPRPGVTGVLGFSNGGLGSTNPEQIFANIGIPGAGFHNSIYRGKYLGSSVTTAQWNAISSGTFNDLFIGDYWTINGVNWRIAGFDYWLHCGDAECTTHHVVIVPDSSLASAKMNSTNITTGAYIGSDMYTGANSNTGLSTAKSTINSAFSSAHILSHRQLFANAVDNGQASGWEWRDSTVDLMNENMVFGSSFCSPQKIGESSYNVGIDRSQLPLFRHDISRACNRTYWWLRGVGSATSFAFVDGAGYVTPVDASNSFGVRPAFGIKG